VSLQPFAVPRALGLLASTGPAGFSLVNGTPSIVSWTAPSDGQLHRVMIFANMDVTSGPGITGGNVSCSFTLPDGTTASLATITGGQGFAGFNFSMFQPNMMVRAGTTVTVSQSSALTAGAAVVWAELWGG
jgi:hypothetical protein